MIWLFVAVVAFLGGLGLGMLTESRGAVRHWVEHGYCATCDRLTTEHELS